MEIHQLRYFLAVARERNFTKAAEQCHVSQPSLSAQIAKLEDELGGSLIERSRKGCGLTPRGELFMPRAREILQQVSAADREMTEFDAGRRGTIRLGCLPTTGAYVLPPLLSAYRREFPEVRIILSEGSSPLLAERLMEHQVDLAIMDQAGMNKDLSGTELFSEPLFIALPAEHPLAGDPELSLRSLADQPLILMRKGHGFNRIVTEALRQAGVEPRVVYESSEIETVQALVRAGLGVSIVPRMICIHPDIAYRRVAGDSPRRTLLMAHRTGAKHSPAALALIDRAARDLRQRFGYT
jgi:LysR family hydrogen peroxide-inducible transcriptional activator